MLDFSGTNLTLRAESGIVLNPTGGAGTSYTYDVVYKVDASTGQLLETRLVASNAAEATLADEAGFIVDLEESTLDRSGASTSFQSYASNATNQGSVNIQTKGGLITEQLSNEDGSSLLRKETDGTVHIGANSIVLSDELVSASGNDEVYSSSNVLQLGDNDNHRTVIKGTLEVSSPTQANHVANKSYVDTGDAATLSSAKSYSDTGDAATLSSAKSYSNGIAAMTFAASQINISDDPTSSLNFGIGFGSMGGENAFALGLGGINQNTDMRYSVTASYSDTTKSVGIGVGLSWSLR
ncbi:YadA C-terminal domain-containing protein [Planktomarina temperata]|nr:YadA C-terminal domain-containing protein [Planktomarina temperata]